MHERQGQTLGELCADLHMARQSATQHLAVLETANLISSVRRGGEKLHYLNPVPLHEVQERWIDQFERPRLRALANLKSLLETGRVLPQAPWELHAELRAASWPATIQTEDRVTKERTARGMPTRTPTQDPAERCGTGSLKASRHALAI